MKKEEIIKYVKNELKIDNDCDIKSKIIELGLGWNGLKYKDDLFLLLYRAIKLGYFDKNKTPEEKFLISYKYL